MLHLRGDNLLETALAAGFGSYAQFHRVFLALRGTTPGKFLRSRGAPEMTKFHATDKKTA